MLKQLRKKKTMKRILWTLAILIIPPFVFWGGGSALRSRQKGPAYAGEIFGKRVSFEQYSAAWQAVRNQAIMMYGSKLDEIYEALNLDEQAWDRLILLREARKKGFRASDREVIDTIQKFPFFQSKERFDKRAYDLILSQVFRIEPRQFEEEIRGTLAISKLRDSIIKDVKISDEEIAQEYKKENEKARIAYILVSPENFLKDIKITEETQKRYYQDNTESFRAGEEINVEYLGFDEKDLAAAERIDYILADKTKSFEETAKENSMPIKETGFFAREGPIPQIGWFPEIQKIGFKLNAGERSELIKSKMGLAKGSYIIKVKEKRPPHIPTFEEVKVKIENILRNEEAERLALKEAERLHKNIKNQISNIKNINQKLKFEEMASKVRRKVIYTEPFARNDYVKGLGMAAELGEGPFNQKGDEVSPVTRTRAGFCIFSAAGITPIDEEKFKNQKEEFAKKVLEAKKLKALNEWYVKLLKRANLKSNIPLEKSFQ